MSSGWLCQVQAEAASGLGPFLSEPKAQLRQAPLLHADETGAGVKTTKQWVHTLTTKLLTLIAVHLKRGVQALKDIAGLPGYTCSIVHDGWTATRCSTPPPTLSAASIYSATSTMSARPQRSSCGRPR